MKFYRVWWDWNENRQRDEWKLRVSWEHDGQPFNVWSYVRCQPVQQVPHPFLEIRHAGMRTDFSLAGAEQVPVISPQLADAIERLAPGDFERIPAMVEDGTPMEIINVLSCIDAIDYEKSVLECYGPKTRVRPDRAGELHVDLHLVLDPTRVGNHHIFRLSELNAPLIVSDTIRSALEEANMIGIVFQPIATESDQPGRLFYWDDELRRNVDWTHEERLAFLHDRDDWKN